MILFTVDTVETKLLKASPRFSGKIKSLNLKIEELFKRQLTLQFLLTESSCYVKRLHIAFLSICLKGKLVLQQSSWTAADNNCHLVRAAERQKSWDSFQNYVKQTSTRKDVGRLRVWHWSSRAAGHTESDRSGETFGPVSCCNPSVSVSLKPWAPDSTFPLPSRCMYGRNNGFQTNTTSDHLILNMINLWLNYKNLCLPWAPSQRLHRILQYTAVYCRILRKGEVSKAFPPPKWPWPSHVP